MGLNFKEKAQPRVDQTLCTGCGQCVNICPDEVLSLVSGKAQPGEGVFVGCIACGHCAAICPHGAISVSGRGMQPDDVVEFPAAAPASADALESLLVRRRSMRHFQNREVPREVVDRILEMTATAPMGIPPSEVGVVVFHGYAKVRALAKNAAAVFKGATAFYNPLTLALLRPILGAEGYMMIRDFVRPLMQTLAEKHAQGEDRFLYDPPAALLFHQSAVGDPSDCHIAATYASLAIESLGLGCCMIGSSVAFNYDKAFKQKYGIPKGNKIGLALTFGYPAVEFRRGVRRRLAEARFA